MGASKAGLSKSETGATPVLLHRSSSDRVIADSAGRLRIDGVDGVSAAARAGRFIPNVLRGAVEVARGRRVGAGLLVFQRPGRLGAIDLSEVGDAGIALTGNAGLDEVGDGDGGQQTD